MNDHGNLYSNHQQRLNTILGASLGDHGWLWPKIRIAKADYLARHSKEHTSESSIDQNFFDYLKLEYGIRIDHTDSGLSLEINIVDDEKLLIFLLRY